MEKMVSYVKFEHELQNEYREKLAECKRKSDVKDVFVEYLFKLLEKIGAKVPRGFNEFIKFSEKGFEYLFVGELEKLVDELSKESDLKAIIERMAESAKHRYTKLEHDENGDYFRKNV